MFDFDKSFADFVKNYMRAEKLTLEDMEDIIADLSVEWSILPQAALGGKSPSDYIAELSDPLDLIAIMKAQSESNLLPQVYDRIAAMPLAAPLLADILSSEESESLKLLAFRLLTENSGSKYAEKMLNYVLRSNGEDEAVRIFVSWAEAHTAPAADILLSSARNASDENRAVIGEILSYLLPDDRIYAYLTELFNSSPNIPFTASLLARYGDIRAIDMLKAAAEDCNYFEFIELRNAVEALGGDLPDTRDWTGDSYFEKISSN